MVTKCLMMDCWHVHNQVRKTSKISKNSCDSWWVISLIAVLEKLGMYLDGLPFDLPWGNQTRHWDRTCANLPLYCGHHLRPRRMFTCSMGMTVITLDQKKVRNGQTYDQFDEVCSISAVRRALLGFSDGCLEEVLSSHLNGGFSAPRWDLQHKSSLL